jgi:tricarballylate dehydrogenase
VLHLLRPEYGIARVTKVRAQTLEELTGKLEDVNPEGFLRTVRAFNAAVRADVPFDPYTRDGRGTVGLEPAKSNWANPIAEPPFEAYATTCGITHLRRSPRRRGRPGARSRCGQDRGALRRRRDGGRDLLFNHPSGAGLVSGAVFGRLAGASAARGRGWI